MSVEHLNQWGGLGKQLRDMASDPTAGLVVVGDVVRRPEDGGEYNNDPPIFVEAQQQLRCATTGLAQVCYFPRHIRR